MEINDVLLNKEEYKHTSGFSKSDIFFWALVIFALCILVALCLLPEGTSVFSQKFWIAILSWPTVVSGFVGLMLIRHRQVDAAEKKHAFEENRAAAMAVASRSLALLGGAYRYTTSPDGDSIDSIADGSVVLTARKRNGNNHEAEGKGAPLMARWFETFSAYPRPNREIGFADFDRQNHLTKWLLEELLERLSPHIAAMPPQMKCVAHLYFGNRVNMRRNLAHWENVASHVLLRLFPVVYQNTDAEGLLKLDRWLDDAISHNGDEARLIVAIQLNDFHREPFPAEGSAEAASAILLMPDALAEKHKLQKVATVHRPVTSSIETHTDAIKLAMRVAAVSGKRISNIWQTGILPAQRGSLSILTQKAEVLAPAIDLDRAVGSTGIAAPWFAVACAQASLCQNGGAQMVTAGGGDKVSTLVLKPARKAVGSVKTVDGRIVRG